jgi:hypothetical protein
MHLELVGVVELRTARVGDHVETHAFLDGRPLRLTGELLDAVAMLATGRVLPPAYAAKLLAAGVVRESIAAAPAGPSADAAGRLRLRATTTLECEQPARLTPAGLVHPAGSVPLTLTMPPAVLGSLQGLAQVLRHAWQQLWRAAIARGVTVDPAVAQAHLESIVRSELATDPALAAAFALETPFRLVPRAPLHDAEVTFPIAGLRIAGDRCWRDRGLRASRWAALDGGVGEHLAAAGRLLGALARGLEASSLEAWLRREPAMQPLVTALQGVDALASAEAGDPPIETPPGTVTHLGHATLLANLGGRHVLVDPWLPPASASDGALRPPQPQQLPDLAGIFLTHHHWDHVHAETLLLLDKQTPVYLPVADRTRPVWPHTELLLRRLGFVDVRPLAHGERVEVGDGGSVEAALFTGEDPCRLGWVGNTYVLRHGDAAALVHVDASPDRDGVSTVSTGSVRALRARHGRLSPVFATRRQELGSMLDYGWEALLAPAAAWVEPTENCATGARFLGELCRDAGAAALVLYSEGGAAWFPPWTNFIPLPGRDAHAAPYQHLWDPLEVIAEAAAAAGATTLVAAPFRRYRLGGGEVEPVAE